MSSMCGLVCVCELLGANLYTSCMHVERHGTYCVLFVVTVHGQANVDSLRDYSQNILAPVVACAAHRTCLISGTSSPGVVVN